MSTCRLENYNLSRGVRILERILISKKASREKKLLALMGLVNIASAGGQFRYRSVSL